jgi:quercetin dioxygenase-like cupin family protein
MNHESEPVDVTRRTLILLGLTGVSTLVAGAPERAVAQDSKGVELKPIKEADSRIAGFPKVKLVEAHFQPGASLPTSKMDQAMVCECTMGSLEVDLGEKKITAKKGDIWTCGVSTLEGVANKGETKAVMRVFILVPA